MVSHTTQIGDAPVSPCERRSCVSLNGFLVHSGCTINSLCWFKNNFWLGTWHYFKSSFLKCIVRIFSSTIQIIWWLFFSKVFRESLEDLFIIFCWGIQNIVRNSNCHCLIRWILVVKDHGRDRMTMNISFPHAVCH